MENLLEIRWHGRGGQGAKTASQLLAEAAMKSGNYIQAFPEYGPERSGAPMAAFTRISDDPINIHSGVHNPEIVVVIDPTLMDSVDVTEGLVKKGLFLVNSTESPDAIRKKIDLQDGRIGTVDATAISLDTIGAAMPNLPMLGALIKSNSIISLEDLENSIREKFSKKIGEEKVKANIEGVKKAYEEVKLE